MAKQVKRRRGSTAEHDVFTGAVGEVTVDTDIQTLVVHDGILAGGYPLAKADLSNADLANKINVAELATTDGAAGHILTTDGNGQISFNVPGGVSPNSVGALELNTADGLAGTVLTTDGGGTLTFASVSVGVDELECIDGTAGQVLTTDGNGTISFTTIDVGTSAVGGDLTGTVSNAQIATDTVSVAELNTVDGTVGQVLTTDGNGTISFTTIDVGGDLTGTVSNASIAVNSVDGTKIALGSDAEGDVLYYNGTDYTKLAIGTAGQSIVTNSSATAPEWTTLEGVPSGIITMWSGAIVAIPSGWVLCDGMNSTPDLRDRFIVGAGSTYAPAATGGSTSTGSHTLSIAEMPSHTHTAVIYGGGKGTGDDNGPVCVISGGTTSGATGGSGAHSHTGTIPPYYALAYIMKS